MADLTDRKAAALKATADELGVAPVALPGYRVVVLAPAPDDWDRRGCEFDLDLAKATGALTA